MDTKNLKKGSGQSLRADTPSDAVRVIADEARARLREATRDDSFFWDGMQNFTAESIGIVMAKTFSIMGDNKNRDAILEVRGQKWELPQPSTPEPRPIPTLTDWGLGGKVVLWPWEGNTPTVSKK